MCRNGGGCWNPGKVNKEGVNQQDWGMTDRLGRVVEGGGAAGSILGI